MNNIEAIRQILKPEKEIHTHISVVFIKDGLVYKVKKPVNFGFVDFSSLEKRKLYCNMELELNRRFEENKDIYLRVEEIKDKYGNILDFALVMKELPLDRCLKNLILENKVTKDDIERIVNRIIDFYRKTTTNEYIMEFGKLDNFRKNLDENFEQTKNYIGKTIERKTFEEIKNLTEKALSELKELIDLRATTGFVRDCHGDLHSDHIILLNDTCYIIDCIEFNERFRYIDIACDFAFLLMDLEYLGREDLSLLAETLYIEKMKDKEAYKVLPLFKSYRAYVRGKVNSFLLDDPNTKDHDKIRTTAKRYFNLAHKYIKGYQ